MQRIVVDTNVLVSSLLGKSFPYRIIKDLVFLGKVHLYYSAEIFKEYELVLSHPKFRKIKNFHAEGIDLLYDLRKIAFSQNPTIHLDLLIDKDDNKFLELASECSADFLITGNSKHFPFGKFGQSIIISPRDYWNEFGKKL